jgi:rubrerythrin
MSQEARLSGEINSVEEFLAHALTLENEAADGYQEIGDSMAVHNNPEVAELFYKFAKYGRMHAEEVASLAVGLELPHLAPWDFAWEDGESPEVPAAGSVHYMMTPTQALKLALRAEQQAHDFYAAVARSSQVAKIREMASEFATEEAEHVRLLTEWIKKYPTSEKTNWDFDPDPPGMPE